MGTAEVFVVEDLIRGIGCKVAEAFGGTRSDRRLAGRGNRAIEIFCVQMAEFAAD